MYLYPIFFHKWHEMLFPDIFVSLKPQTFFHWKDTDLYIRKPASLPSAGPLAQESNLEA